MNTKRYAELFRAESRERLAEMNTALLALERGEGIERVAELFRAVHTVKGMAAAMGYDAVRDLSHALETLLDQLRRGDCVITADLIEALFEAVDTLEVAVVAVSQPSKQVDIAPSIAKIEALTPAERNEVQQPNPTMEWPVMRADPPPVPSSPLHPTPSVGASSFGFAQSAAQNGEKAHRFVRVDAERLDTLMTLIGELVIARGRLQDVARKASNPALSEAVLQASKLIGSLQTEITTARMVPVGQAFERFERMVRDTAHSLGKKVVFEILGSDIEVDKSVLDEIGDPVMHLLRNSLDHGVESPSERRAAGKSSVAKLTLSASRERSSVVIRVSDDGRGIDVTRVLERAKAAGLFQEEEPGVISDAEILTLIARPGFSTTSRVTDISGRGVGLDVVATKVRSLGGAVELATDAGAGTEIRLELPMTLAIIHALLARSEDEVYALPITHVVETLIFDPEMIRFEDDREMLSVRGQSMPAVRLRERLGHPPREKGGHVVVLDLPDGRMSLVVDEFVGQQEVVVKSFDAARGMPQLFNGATILTNGSPALILDAQGIA